MIERLALFANVLRDDGEDILSAARKKDFACKEILFSDGDPVREVIMLLSGRVKVTQTGLNGNEVILWLHRDGEIIGSGLRPDSANRRSTALAVQPSTALVWEATAFEKLLHRVPAFRRNIMRALEERLREMERGFREISTQESTIPRIL